MHLPAWCPPSVFSVSPLSTFYCQASLCLCVFLSPNPHPTCAQRRLHNRRTLSMFFVSTVPAPAVCLSTLCSSVLSPEPVCCVSVLMQAVSVCVCVCVCVCVRERE